MPQPIRLKDHEKDARLVKRRVLVGGVVIILLTCVLIMRMYYLQVIQYEHHSTLAENNRIHVQPIPPTRGLIFDRNGVIIADNRPSFSLTVTRERAGDWPSVLDAVVEVLELSEDDRALFERRVRQGRRPFEPVPILFELSEEQIARIAVNQFRLPGVEVAAQLAPQRISAQPTKESGVLAEAREGGSCIERTSTRSGDPTALRRRDHLLRHQIDQGFSTHDETHGRTLRHARGAGAPEGSFVPATRRDPALVETPE